MLRLVQDQFHPAISLLYNIVGAALLGYLLLSNPDVVNYWLKRLRRSQMKNALEVKLKGVKYVDENQST